MCYHNYGTGDLFEVELLESDSRELQITAAVLLR